MLHDALECLLARNGHERRTYSQRLHRLKHRLYMPRHFDAAPFAAQHSALIDQESRAFDAAHCLAIHLFDLDHVEQGAQRLIDVRNQLNGSVYLVLKASCDLSESREIPAMTAPAWLNDSNRSRNAILSEVHPGVSSFG